MMENTEITAPSPPPALPPFRAAKAEAVQRFEIDYLRQALAQAHGNVSRAARLAGKERRAFGKLMKKHGLTAGAGR